MAGISELYLRKFPRKVEQYNKDSQLPEYFRELIGDKESVLIAELGAGPVNTIGNQWPGVKVEVIASDVLADEYDELWDKIKEVPLVPVVFKDMEYLDYPNDTFDIVHCRNAVDHTKNAYIAIEEMKRVCKPGGWVYLIHAPGQKKRYRGHHYHNFEELELADFQRTIDDEGLIICKWKKT